MLRAMREIVRENAEAESAQFCKRKGNTMHCHKLNKSIDYADLISCHLYSNHAKSIWYLPGSLSLWSKVPTNEATLHELLAPFSSHNADDDYPAL